MGDSTPAVVLTVVLFAVLLTVVVAGAPVVTGRVSFSRYCLEFRVRDRFGLARCRNFPRGFWFRLGL